MYRRSSATPQGFLDCLVFGPRGTACDLGTATVGSPDPSLAENPGCSSAPDYCHYCPGSQLSVTASPSLLSGRPGTVTHR